MINKQIDFFQTIVSNYEKNAETFYEIISYFYEEPHCSEILNLYAEKLQQSFKNNPYSKYSNIFCLKILFDQLEDKNKYSPIKQRFKKNFLHFEDIFVLLMRDKFHLKVQEISATTGFSEGTIRTKLKKIRFKLFDEKKSDQELLLTHNKKSSLAKIQEKNIEHICSIHEDFIEDLEPTKEEKISIEPALLNEFLSCNRCQLFLVLRTESIDHFKKLIFPLLPEVLRKFPIQPVFQRKMKNYSINWNATPWYVKALFEGILATTLILGIVISIPRIKGLYDFWLEKRFDLYGITEMTANLSMNHFGGSESPGNEGDKSATSIFNDPNREDPHSDHLMKVSNTTGLPTATTMPISPWAPLVKNIPQNSLFNSKSETEFGGKDTEVAASDKLYRVFIKTDSPEALKEQVFQILKNFQYDVGDPNAMPGTELPGGVIFDILILNKKYHDLVSELLKLGETKVIVTRLKERPVPGKAHLKIWLQRI